MNIIFLMPAKKNKGILTAIEECHSRRRKAILQYTITNKDGKTFTFTLIIKKAGNKSGDNESGKKRKGKQIPISERYIAFATNVPVQQALREINQIPKEYRKRWGIETAYRQIEEIRPWTPSPDKVYRVILFYVLIFMHNTWAIKRVRRGVNLRDITLKSLAHMTALVMFCEITGIPFDPGGYI